MLPHYLNASHSSEGTALLPYDSGASTTPKPAEECEQNVEQTRNRRGTSDFRRQITGNLLLVTFLVAFAALLTSHVATVARINKMKSVLQYDPAGKAVENQKKSAAAKAQSFAKQSLREKLSKPTLQSELFYNGGGSDVEILTRNSHDEEGHTPLPPPSEGCDATLMLFRHCEGGLAREHCGFMGTQRSEYLATLFGEGGKWPVPSYLIAMAEGERHNPSVKNWREIETLQPLANKVNMEIDTSYGFPEKNELTDYIYSLLRSGEMCGKLAVLSWKHHDIPHFAHSMGCGPEEGCPISFEEYDYDHVWEIKYNYHLPKYAPFVAEDHSKKGNKKRKRHPWGNHPEWVVYGTVRSEAFDPLQYSTMMGLYK